METIIYTNKLAIGISLKIAGIIYAGTRLPNNNEEGLSTDISLLKETS